MCTTTYSVKYFLILLGSISFLGDSVKGQRLAVELSDAEIQQHSGKANENVQQVIGEALNTFRQEEQAYDANRPPITQPPTFVQVQEKEQERETFTPGDFESSVDIKNSFLPPKYKYYDQQKINQTSKLVVNQTIPSPQIPPVPETETQKQNVSKVQETLSISNETSQDKQGEEIIPIYEDHENQLEDFETGNFKDSDENQECEYTEQIEESSTDQEKNKKDKKIKDNEDSSLKATYQLILLSPIVILLFAYV